MAEKNAYEHHKFPYWLKLQLKFLQFLIFISHMYVFLTCHCNITCMYFQVCLPFDEVEAFKILFQKTLANQICHLLQFIK